MIGDTLDKLTVSRRPLWLTLGALHLLQSCQEVLQKNLILYPLLQLLSHRVEDRFRIKTALLLISLLLTSIAEKTIDYAEAKEAYFKASQAEVPELMKIATGREARPPEVDTFAAAFAVAGEDQEKVADEETLVLLKRFSGNPDVQKARAEFERAQRVEERFHKDFDGVDFTKR